MAKAKTKNELDKDLMYSKLMPIEKETPSRIIREIKRLLVKNHGDDKGGMDDVMGKDTAR